MLKLVSGVLTLTTVNKLRNLLPRSLAPFFIMLVLGEGGLVTELQRGNYLPVQLVNHFCSKTGLGKFFSFKDPLNFLPDQRPEPVTGGGSLGLRVSAVNSPPCRGEGAQSALTGGISGQHDDEEQDHRQHKPHLSITDLTPHTSLAGGSRLTTGPGHLLNTS